MSVRELVVLGTASQAPTRARNHNGYLLRFDDEGVLFDPGEGTQRQLLLAGVASSGVTRICITHFHGDHCLGLPGVLMRMGLDQVTHAVDAYFPESGADYFTRLRTCAIYGGGPRLREHPVPPRPGVVGTARTFTLAAAPLLHRVPTVGYRVTEPAGLRFLPERLAAFGLAGPIVGRLQRAGFVDVDGRRVTIEQVTEPRPGQSVAFVMDTALCPGAFELAGGVDMLVCESTFLESDGDLARLYGHLTAAQAGRLAAESGVRTLVLTHFSQRHPDPRGYADEAAGQFNGEIVLAEDLTRIPLPPRR